MKIAFIYTGAILIPTLSAKIKNKIPNIEVVNILDDSLVGDCIKYKGMTILTQGKLCKLYQYAYELGADMIVNTCSSVGETVSLAKEIIPVPVLRIDEPMAEAAVKMGKRIGVIATLQSTLLPTCRLLEKKADECSKDITVVQGLAYGAYEAACTGNTDLHDSAIMNTAINLKDDCDVYVLAQGSMARMQEAIEQKTNVPVLSSLDIFVDYLAEKLKKK